MERQRVMTRLEERMMRLVWRIGDTDPVERFWAGVEFDQLWAIYDTLKAAV